jgi:hypothetical protein
MRVESSSEDEGAWAMLSFVETPGVVIAWRGTLREYLKLALAGTAPGGWSFLPKGELTLESRCVVVGADIDTDEEAVPRAALKEGCEREGLDGETAESVAGWAREFQDPPSDELLLESFLYYWRYDAFLPSPGAPPPPKMTIEELQHQDDRKLYESLGAESSESGCREEGCKRGAISQSAFCKRHHFEMLMRRKCPFDD